MNRVVHIFVATFLCFYYAVWSAFAITVEVTATVPGCGDGVIGIGEQCDGSNLGGSSCSSLGFTGGVLSCASLCTFNTTQCTSGSSGGGGGGGGGGFTPIPSTNIVFTGRAYPKSTVTLLKDAEIVATTVAGANADFQVTISGSSGGNYLFSIYSEDAKGARSPLQTFPVSVTSGVTTKVSGIFIAPTIILDKREVRRGDTITIFGQSVPGSEVTINVNSAEEFFIKKPTDATGAYLLHFDTSVLETGEHHARSKASLNGEITAFGKSAGFIVGTKNIFAEVPKSAVKGDLNSDKRINLVDFSIVAYWYKRLNPPASVDFNNDKKVDLIDFSIMAFHWTG